MHARILAPLFLVALPALAQAATPIDETRPLDARGKVEISNLLGRIQVRTWDKPQVHVGGSLGKDVDKLEIDGGGSSLSIKVRYPRNGNGRVLEPTDLVLDVPALASLDIDSVSADVDVDGTAGARLDIDSVSGRVVAVGAPKSADVESVSGEVHLNLNSADIDAQTVSGNLELRGRLTGEVKAETVSGTIRVDSRGERVRRLGANTVSGNATLQAGLADGGRIEAESVSGDITVIAPKSLSATVKGESFSGRLEAPGASIHKPKFGPGSDFEQRYGDGNGEIRIQTFSGDGRLELR